MVKTKLALNPALLVVPTSIAEPRLREAGLAWIDMALELFAQEVFSAVKLDWWRKIDGSENHLLVSLDSSKNFRTKGFGEQAGAPADVGQRRERLDSGVAKLIVRTTPQDLWAALVNHHLASVDAQYLGDAWRQKTRGTSLEDTYPAFTDSREFLFYLTQARGIPTHPWI
jgi:hypothetical protein